MIKQEILGVKLTLKSEGGIKPLMDYNGRGRMTKDGDGFLFVEKPYKKRVNNTRVAKTSEGNLMMREVATGRFKIQLYLEDNEVTMKAIMEKVRQLLAEAKEGGWL